VVVVGSLNRDYVFGVERLPAPGETVLAAEMSVGSGGKGGNQAVAASLTGARTVMVGAVGGDEDGRALLADLEAAGVDTYPVDVVTGVPTGRAFIAVSSDGENCIVVAPGANQRCDPDGVSSRLRPLLGPGVVVVTQTELPLRTVEAVLAVAAEGGCRAVLNLAPVLPLADRFLKSCDPLVVNAAEAAALLGRDLDGVEAALDGALALQRLATSVVVTLGRDGAVVAAEGVLEHVATEPVRVVDTTGAGDALTGALAAALSRGERLTDAVRFGVRAGTYAVTGAGAQAAYATSADLDGEAAAGRE
jgi:ribokinase